MVRRVLSIAQGMTGGPAALGRAALDLGFDGVALRSPLCEPAWLELQALLPPRRVAALEVFLPLPRALDGRPELPFSPAHPSPLEASESLAQAEKTVLAADRAEIPLILVPPVQLDPTLREGWQALRSGQPFLEERRRALLDRRATLVPRALDSLRRFLDRLLGAADRYGRGIALIPGGFPDELPSVRETGGLLAELRGAPLGVWPDLVRVVASWPGEDLKSWPLLAGALGLDLGDLDQNLAPTAPGRGTVARSWALPLLEAAPVWALDPRGNVDPGSLEEGKTWLDELAEPPPPPPSGLLGF